MQINKVSTLNNTNFQAVNMKYFKKAKDACITNGHLNEHLFCLEVDVAYKNILAQDALDTLKALLPYAKEHHLRLFKKYKESIEDLKKEFEEEFKKEN